MIKVYIPNEYRSPILATTRHHDTPFEFEKDRFVITHVVEEADVIPILPSKDPALVDSQFQYLGKISDNQLLLLMMHTHITDFDGIQCMEEHISPWRKYSNNIKITHLNQHLTDYPDGIPYDFCFNQVKAYFTDYDKFDLTDRLWTFSATKAMFNLGDLIKIPPCRPFLSPNVVSTEREGLARNSFRKELHDFIPQLSTWRGDPANGYCLYPEELSPVIMENLTGGGWAPVANRYYQQSFVTACVETITFGNIARTITEKTLTSFIKGHFVLPFGYKGIVKDILDRGFLLPDWIDYSYDQLDDDVRFEAYKESINKVLEIDHRYLMLFFEQDKHILEHNRQKFFTDNYDSLYDKLLPIVKVTQNI